nr:Rieske domain-containing protein-like [Biomphalaria glabrata]
MAEPIFACTMKDLQQNGGRKRMTIDGKDIFIVLHKGQLYAFDSFCYHAGGPLCQDLKTQQQPITYSCGVFAVENNSTRCYLQTNDSANYPECCEPVLYCIGSSGFDPSKLQTPTTLASTNAPITKPKITPKPAKKPTPKPTRKPALPASRPTRSYTKTGTQTCTKTLSK